MTEAAPPFVLSDRHKAEIVRIDAELADRIGHIERAIDEHLNGVRPFDAAHLASMGDTDFHDWRGVPLETILGGREALPQIAKLARALIEQIAAVPTFRKEELAGLLERHRGGEGLTAALAEPRPVASWFPQDAPPALVPHLKVIRRIYEEALGMKPEKRRKRGPDGFDKLVHGLVAAVQFWPDSRAQKVKFNRLVSLCLEAAGKRQSSNIPQLVRRALDEWDKGEGEAHREFDLWEVHCEQKCDPQGCQFCSL